MRCPNDETTLVMSERGGIEIDYCPECRGVWLDRGELDKIIDRSLTQPGPAVQQAPPQQAPRQPDYQQYDDRRRPEQSSYGYPQQQGHYKKKRKESWLSELFD